MLPEGMVHALEQIHCLLIPGGNLIDIHPVPGPMLVELHQEGSILFSQPNPRSWVADYLNADQALARVVKGGLFTPAGSREFDYLVYGSSVSGLCEYLDRVNAHEEPSPEDVEAAREQEFYQQVDLTMHTMGDGVEVVTRERTRVALYKAVK